MYRVLQEMRAPTQLSTGITEHVQSSSLTCTEPEDVDATCRTHGVAAAVCVRVPRAAHRFSWLLLGATTTLCVLPGMLCWGWLFGKLFCPV